MKLVAFTVAAFATLAAAANKDVCKAQHPKVYDAINRFCAIQNMVIPSDYASKGVSNAGAKVWIDSLLFCKPAQWVPSQYCFPQFYKICAAGKTTAFYGKANCQSWKIKYAAQKAKPAPAKPQPKPGKATMPYTIKPGFGNRCAGLASCTVHLKREEATPAPAEATEL